MSDYSQILKRELETTSSKDEDKEEKIVVSNPNSSIKSQEKEEKKEETSSPFVFKKEDEGKKIEKKEVNFDNKTKELKKKYFINPPIVSKYDLDEKFIVWVSLSEASSIGGVQTKTLRRAIKSGRLRYKIVKNRYLVDFSSLINLLLSTKKLRNKLNESGVGQYVKEWKLPK